MTDFGASKIIPSQFTTREFAVFELLAHGQADKEIAAELRITVRTVRFHISNLFKKTGATSRVQLAIQVAAAGA